jgi:hypothetical protein
LLSLAYVMEYVPDKFDVALMLSDNGELLATNYGEGLSSLYRYNGKFYVVCYTKENVLEKIGIVGLQTAKKMFKNFTG